MLELKPNLQPIGTLLRGRGLRVKVSLLIKASYSASTAVNHVGSTTACLVDLGSKWVKIRVGFILLWKMPNLDMLCIGWLFWGTLWTFSTKHWKEQLLEEGLGEGMWDWSEETVICEGCGVETVVGDRWERTTKY